MTTSQYHITQPLHYMRENVTLLTFNNLHIIFGVIRCLTLYISRASFWIFWWCIVKEFFFFEKAHRKKRGCHYGLNVALLLEVYLLCCSMFDCETSRLRDNMRTEKIKIALIIVLSLSLLIYFEIRPKSYNL